MLLDREIFKRPVSLEEHYQPPAKLRIVSLCSKLPNQMTLASGSRLNGVFAMVPQE